MTSLALIASLAMAMFLSQEPLDKIAVIEAVIGGPVGLHDAPVRQIRKEQVRRIDDAGFSLCTRSAAQRDVAGAQNGMPTDIPVGLHHDHGSALLGSFNCGGESYSTCPHDNHIGLPCPLEG